MAGMEKRKKCLTVIPKSWPQFTGPGVKDGVSVRDANRAWREFLKMHEQVTPTPRISRHSQGY